MGKITELSQGSLNGLRRQLNECIENAYNKGYADGKKEPKEVKAVLSCKDTIRDMASGEIKNIVYIDDIKALPPVTPTQTWIPLVWDEYPTVDSHGNDDYVYAVDYSVPMPNEDEWVLITDENHNVVSVQYDGYDFGDYARENILAWQPLPEPYKES